MRRPELTALTSLRFFAALGVFLSHTGMMLALFEPLEHVAKTYFLAGWSGVTFFFVLSGFVLTWTYHGRLTGLDGGTLWNFWVARIARLYPVFLATVLFGAWLYRAFPQPPGDTSLRWFANLVMLQHFIPGQAGEFNPVAWSVSVEMYFYLAFPLLAVAAWRMRDVGARSILAILALLLVLPPLSSPLLADRYATGWAGWLKHLELYTIMLEFLAGVVLGWLFLTTHERVRAAIATPHRRIAATTLEILSLGSIVLTIHAAPWVERTVGHYDLYQGPMVYVPAFAFCIFVFAFNEGLISRAVSVRPLRILGEASYGLYMYHFLLIDWFRLKSPWAPYLMAHQARFAVIALVAAIALSIASYYLFETPWRKAIRSTLTRRRVPPPIVRDPEVDTLERSLVGANAGR